MFSIFECHDESGKDIGEQSTLIDSGLPSINGRSMTIDFPAGALAEEIDVSITELQQQDIFGSQPGGFLGPILGSIVDLQPHGTEFSTCVTIELPIFTPILTLIMLW